MSIAWEILVPAILLLGFALPLRWGAVDPAESHRRDAEHPTLRGMMRAWQNWIDLARAPLGVVLLHNSFVMDSQASALATQQVVWIKAGILIVGVLVQLFHFDEGIGIYAPNGYLAGMTPALSGVLPGGFAVLFGLLFVVGAKDPRWLLPIVSGGLAVSAYFFDQVTFWTGLNAALLVLPFVLAFVVRRFPLHVSREARPAVAALATFAEAAQFRKQASAMPHENPLKSE